MRGGSSSSGGGLCGLALLLAVMVFQLGGLQLLVLELLLLEYTARKAVSVTVAMVTVGERQQIAAAAGGDRGAGRRVLGRVRPTGRSRPRCGYGGGGVR